MTLPTSALQRLDPRMLDPDTLETSTMQGIVAPGQDDATRGFLGATMPYLRRMREQRAADYVDSTNKANDLQSLMQQRALQEAARKTNVDAGLNLMQHGGFDPRAVSDLGATLNPGALASINSTQALRDKGLQGKVALDFAQASKAQSESDAAMSPDTLTQASGLKFEPNVANSLERARIAASAKSGGTNTVTIQTTGVGNDGNPVVITNKGPATAQTYAGANVAQPSTGQTAPVIPMSPKASAAIDQINATRVAEGKLPLRKNAFVQQPNGSYVLQGTSKTMIIDQFGKVSEK